MRERNAVPRHHYRPQGAWGIAALWIAMAGLSLLASPTSFAAPQTEHALQQAPKGYTTPVVVRYRYEATNTTNQTMPKAVFRVATPAVRTSRQALARLTTNLPSEFETDPTGNALLRFDVGPLAPYAVAVVVVTAELKMAESPQPSPRKPETGTGSEPYIELDATAVTEAHDKLFPPAKAASAHASVEQRARRIYDWVVSTITDTGFHARERGAAWALEHREGDCTEMAQVFVALARRAEIPARVVGGYAIESNGLLTPEQFHNWAEWHDGTAWREADPQKRVWTVESQHYVATRLFGKDQGRDLIQWTSDTPSLGVTMVGRR